MQIAQRRHIFLYFAIASFLVASGIAAVGLVSHDSVLENEYVALAILGVACAAPPVLALVRRRFDLFEPINAFVLSTSRMLDRESASSIPGCPAESK